MAMLERLNIRGIRNFGIEMGDEQVSNLNELLKGLCANEFHHRTMKLLGWYFLRMFVL